MKGIRASAPYEKYIMYKVFHKRDIVEDAAVIDVKKQIKIVKKNGVKTESYRANQNRS